jgi:antitoxin (DNA-binding transcriptional repressor) of toxin-antitoxin stability system
VQDLVLDFPLPLSDYPIIWLVMKTITVTDAALNLSAIVNRVHYLGEETILTKGGRQMVRIVPTRVAKTGAELAGIWPALPHLVADEAQTLGRDVASAHANLSD